MKYLLFPNKNLQVVFGLGSQNWKFSKGEVKQTIDNNISKTQFYTTTIYIIRIAHQLINCMTGRLIFMKNGQDPTGCD